jgi:hypothetical protein
MSDEVYMPCHKSRGWIRCTFNSLDNHIFQYVSSWKIFPSSPSPSRRVYLEGSERFLLRAKYLDNIFYISTDEHFDISDPSQGGYIAKLMSVPLSLHPSSSPLMLTLLDRPKTHLLMFSSRQPVAIVITNWGATSAVLTPHREKSSPRSLMSLPPSPSALPPLPPSDSLHRSIAAIV